MSTKPRVWCTFTAKSQFGDLKLRIQDVPDGRLDEVQSFFQEYLVPEETFLKATGVIKNKEALDEAKLGFRFMMEGSRMVMVCIDDGSDVGGELISASAINLVKKGEPGFRKINRKPKSKEMAKAAEIFGSLFQKVDVMEQFNIDSYFEGKGVVTHPDYRGLGLAQRLLHIRRQICKEEGVPLTGVFLTAIGSQKAAERDGWETTFEVPLAELGEQFGVKFEDSPTMCKYMIGRPVD